MPTDPFLRLTVEDVFEIKGRGTVLTGRLDRGALQVGDEVTLQGPSGVRQTTVTGIEMFRKVVEGAKKGDTVGLLLAGVGKDDIKRGTVLTR